MRTKKELGEILLGISIICLFLVIVFSLWKGTNLIGLDLFLAVACIISGAFGIGIIYEELE